MRRPAGILALTAALAAGAAPPAAAAPLRAELDRAVRGTDTAVHVVDAVGGRALYARRATARRPLASTTKVLTAVAVLDVLGAGSSLTTQVLTTGPVEPDGTLRGDVVLRGGGDPDFGGPGADALAGAVVAAGVRRITGAVVADETRFDALRGGPSTAGAFDAQIGAPLSALSFDRGALRPGEPPRADAIEQAAAKFDDRLEARGVVLPNFPRVGAAPPGARLLGEHRSATLRELVGGMLARSDNFVAEMLSKTLAAERAVPGTSAGGAAIIHAYAGRGARIVDGTGLDRRNRASARHLTRALLLARALRADSLLARGGTGTLEGRLRGLPCRVKTGTLSGVSNLAGFCRTRRGRTVVFAVLGRSGRVADRLVRTLVRRDRR